MVLPLVLWTGATSRHRGVNVTQIAMVTLRKATPLPKRSVCVQYHFRERVYWIGITIPLESVKCEASHRDGRRFPATQAKFVLLRSDSYSHFYYSNPFKNFMFTLYSEGDLNANDLTLCYVTLSGWPAKNSSSIASCCCTAAGVLCFTGGSDVAGWRKHKTRLILEIQNHPFAPS